MNPNDLADELEAQNYDNWLNLMLDNVPDDIDKREGSIIFDAIAPVAMVSAQQSLSLANILRETYIKTAQGEFLDYRAVERGTSRYAATNTEVKAKFNDDDGNPANVEVGDRFASIAESPIFYTVVKANNDGTAEMQAEEAGTSANSYIGQVLPVTPNDNLAWAEITEVTIPARDEETDDHLRARLLNSNSWVAYGGNVADYLDMTSKIHDVGATQVYPTWDGPGTVKLVILNNDLMPASQTLIKKVKEEIDPEESTTQGYGLAPIDHRVTVVAPATFKVDIAMNVTIVDSMNIESIRANIKTSLEEFFKSLRRDWSAVNPTVGRGYSMTIYRSKILSRVMMLEGVANATIPRLNGKDEDLQLVFNNTASQLPVLGEVTVNG
ncbi:MAG: baseplate J/gp47 family protein [Lactobacillus sp.]|uniref:baseplate J/gp47 family protein n=1 Tax=Lactobacillus sp. TaxID=1591 RepID=UPI002649BB76|nr:baseplate J/gp47 family protein [Lactobacillus sp.]MDN5955095.1 baseplate J/gp47 family protein [Lactobacillus sp.]MDN5988587.1 baseplate J/gp47 family protein [Lactobacillus sp.]MDN6007633.1 baseplate J/gp47 family protein [Lactobacillus sp.]MDN6589930.1 baseplate J/gp47 family protein [Lactobacillus sp.]MDN6653438.1 baseplate J/gp47 family protein [Lactobacillus sp.]